MSDAAAALPLLELRIQGPAFESVHTLAPGGADLVLGRDADCDVCLPDPQRNISRRHLALRNQGGELHFQVLSVVNGVLMPFGEAPPGARGVLAAGEELQLADYCIRVQAGAAPEDPWEVLERESTGGAAAPVAAGSAHEDPFGDWGFETTFGPGATSGPLQASSLAAAGDLTAFFRGLGLDNEQAPTLTEGELESLGQLVRSLVLGVLELQAARAQAPQDLPSAERAPRRPQDTNPLQQPQWPAETKLRYLVSGSATAGHFMPPQRAVRALMADLLAHAQASQAATRATLVGTLQEFDPAQLKARLLGPGSKLFEAARAWDAYGHDYARRSADLPAWTQRLLDNYFTVAYQEERERRRCAGERFEGP